MAKSPNLKKTKKLNYWRCTNIETPMIPVNCTTKSNRFDEKNKNNWGLKMTEKMLWKWKIEYHAENNSLSGDFSWCNKIIVN